MSIPIGSHMSLSENLSELTPTILEKAFDSLLM